MGKYESLTRYLECADGDSIDANFSEIEAILGFPLPRSAYRYQAWWANQADGSHTHARGWQDAGWETRLVNLSHRTVRFERKSGLREKRTPFRHEQPESLDDLVRRGMKVSGIQNPDELLRAALTTFIQREAGRQLALMGGTMPDLQVPARERPPHDPD